MNKVMNICLISDDKYLSYIATLIVSILKNSSENDTFCFHFIGLDIKEENKNKLLMLKEIKDFEIKFYNPNYDNIEKYKKWQETFKKNGYSWHYSIFIKLDIPFILKDLDNVLFIDADSIVLGNINYIYNMDISNYSFVSEKEFYEDLEKRLPLLYKYMLDIGYEDPETNYIGGPVLFFNIKRIKEIFTKESYQNRIDECISKYINSIFTEEHVFLYLFKGNNVYLDLKTDYGFSEEKIIISDYFAGRGKPINYDFDREINEYYYKFWEYFSLTQFFKDNSLKYMDIFYTNKIKCVLYKITDKIVWYIPFRKLRDKLRDKIIRDINNIIIRDVNKNKM